jgi:hypothetical protein
MTQPGSRKFDLNRYEPWQIVLVAGVAGMLMVLVPVLVVILLAR